MTRVKKLEREIQKLSRDELVAFREWFRAYDSDEWDRQIEQDVRDGRLDELAHKAVSEHRSGKTREL